MLRFSSNISNSRLQITGLADIDGVYKFHSFSFETFCTNHNDLDSLLALTVE